MKKKLLAKIILKVDGKTDLVFDFTSNGKPREISEQEVQNAINLLSIRYENAKKNADLLLRLLRSNNVQPREFDIEIDRTTLTFFASEIIKLSASEKAKIRADTRYLADPKQKTKLDVLDHWKQWQENPAQYKNKAEFARDMLDAYDILKSHKKITDWCRVWEKGLS